MFQFGVFEKFPRLKVVVLESGAGWIGYWIERMDAVYATPLGRNTGLSEKPSVYFQRQCWISCDPDERSLAGVIPRVGEDKFFWASDFPHPDHAPCYLTELAELERRLSALREMRLTRARRIVERLHELGIALSLDAVLQHAAGGAVGRPHVARAMIAAGFATDFREAFERYLGNGKPAFVPKDKLPLAEAFGLIHRAGGLAVLAHPGQLGTKDRIAALAALGLDGIEILHPSHSWDDSQRLDALAGEFDLVRSGGSDWHGGQDGARSLGMMRVPAKWLSDQDARVAARGSRRVA